jgi:XRE family transcriptional regulator, fatty acid utilization regulator
MLPNSEIARLIFGLKIRQLRLDKGIPSSEVARLSGLSPSYLNEIEKGKKYPKVEKIFELARALDTDYDSLVSLKLTKKLEPLAELLNSKILNELPLDWLGLDQYSLLELLWDAPTKVSAFISTIIEISRSYGMKVEGFFFSVLRTYQEIHDNYFPELEEAAENFRKEIKVDEDVLIKSEDLISLLKGRYGYKIQTYTATEYPEFATLRSLFFPAKGNLLLINEALTPEQSAFTYARELGYQHLKLTNRPLISSVLEAESFEQVMNNFQASYFAGALLMPKNRMINQLEEIFGNPVWQPRQILSLLQTFNTTPEMLMHRTSGLLATHFGLNNLFFLRLNNKQGEKEYHLNKEMHLSRLHNPHNTIAEHYCRRWICVKVLEELHAKQATNTWDGEPIIKAQISDYFDSENSYFILAIGYPSPPQVNVNSSLLLGISYNEKLRQTIRFTNDPAIRHRVVNETCERCGIHDCEERAAKPEIYLKQQQLEKVKAKFDNF